MCRTQVVYGLVFLATSALRLTLVLTLPVDTAVWVSGVMLPAGIVLAVLASAPFTGRAASVVEAASGAGAGARTGADGSGDAAPDAEPRPAGPAPAPGVRDVRPVR